MTHNPYDPYDRRQAQIDEDRKRDQLEEISHGIRMLRVALDREGYFERGAALLRLLNSSPDHRWRPYYYDPDVSDEVIVDRIDEDLKKLDLIREEIKLVRDEIKREIELARDDTK